LTRTYTQIHRSKRLDTVYNVVSALYTLATKVSLDVYNHNQHPTTPTPHHACPKPSLLQPITSGEAEPSTPAAQHSPLCWNYEPPICSVSKNSTRIPGISSTPPFLTTDA